jgi:high-affinity nickel-transport protein
MVGDIKTFIAVSIPAMFFFGIRHAVDVDHITAIDNLVRMHNARKRARWVGAGFSIGHMTSVLGEMLLIIYTIGSATNGKVDQLSFWGGVIGAIALATIGAINIYSMKRWGKTGSAILASKVVSRTHVMGPFGSAVITGLVFGLGFDTATQISALTLTVAASATLGVQVALILAGFFALGMIPIDTLESVVLRSAFSRIFNTKGLTYMAYALSGLALAIAAMESYSVISNSNILPPFTGPVLAVTIISAALGYSFATRNRKAKVTSTHTSMDSKLKETEK